MWFRSDLNHIGGRAYVALIGSKPHRRPKPPHVIGDVLFYHGIVTVFVDGSYWMFAHAKASSKS